MRIAVNMGTLRGYGSRQVGQGVLRQLEGIRGGVEIGAWIPEEWDWKEQECGAVELRRVKKGLYNKFRLEAIGLRGALRRGKFDVLFSLGDTGVPNCPVAHLLMVQQAFLVYGRHERDFKTSVRFEWKIRLMEYYFKWGLRTASMITVQTDCMKRRLAGRWGFPPERIIVVPSAVELPQSGGREVESGQRRPYVCYIASGGPHKNHVILADMLAALRARGRNVRCRVTVLPESVPDLVARARSLDVESWIEFVGPIEKHEMPNLVKGALAVVIPSKLESFGLPYYEAMALGCPVIAADRDFAREACGDAGLFADANDGEEFAKQVTSLLESPDKELDFRSRARKRFDAVQISWSKIAARYLEILAEVGRIGRP